MKVAILIVVYNKQLNESETLISLIRLLKDNNEKIAYCRIVNNGPIEINNDLLIPDNMVVDFIQSITNRPLSMIYNDFIDDYESFDRFVVLDDDSELNRQYLDIVFQEQHYDIELPKIYDNNGKVFFPIINNKVITPVQNNIDNSKNVITSISSGLIISNKVFDLFRENGIKPFNESFAFYGVDTSFFWELNKSVFDNLQISSNSKIIHDLSMTGFISESRKLEMDLAIFLELRHYPYLVNFEIATKRLLNAIKERRWQALIAMSKTFLKGKHPKCI